MIPLFLNIFSAFIVAFITSNLIEWLVHKYVLHGLGKNKNSWFHFHWQHHHVVRKNNFVDEDYKLGFFKSSAFRREVMSLVALLVVNSWICFVWPILYAWLVFFTALYFFCHAYSHINVVWGKKWLPHHFDHHRGIDQDKNWVVTFVPLWDWIMGTRVKYVYDEKGKATHEIS